MEIVGDVFVDERGHVVFFNDFDIFSKKIKRMYIIENFNNNIIRAYHGHNVEEKYAYVITGAAMFIIAKIENNKLVNPTKTVLSDKKPKILYIPAGYAHGFRSMKANTRIIFFSTSSLDESQQDDIRFKWDYFGHEIWEVDNK